MLKTHKYIIIAVLGIICISGLLFYNYGLIPEVDVKKSSSNDDNEEFENPENAGDGIVLIVNYNNGSRKYVENITVTSENNTVFDVLKAFCDVDYTEYHSGSVFIDAIDGIENKDPNWWQYWVNDEYAPVGASDYHLDDKDKVKWVYGNSDSEDSNSKNEINNEVLSKNPPPYLIIIISSIVALSSVVFLFFMIKTENFKIYRKIHE